MGATLQRATTWTSASDEGRGKLEFSPLNEKILGEIIKFVEAFPSKHPNESDHVFKDALQWTTTMMTSDFGAGGFDVTGTKVASSEKDPKGSPLLEVDGGVVRVRSLRIASKLMRAAGSLKSKLELRACLEANIDPIVKILGAAFATVDDEDSTLIRMIEQNKSSSGEGAPSSGGLEVHLMLIIQQLDMKLLNYCLNETSKQVRLTPEAVNAQVELLMRFAGNEGNTPLRDIAFTSNHVFNNACRALPWRQLNGDICYVNVKPHDGERFCITASTYGCFVNGGFDEDAQEVNFEKRGDVYSDVISLLRHKSAKFTENIDKQEFSSRAELTSEHGDDVTVSEDGEEIEKEAEAASEKKKQQQEVEELEREKSNQRKKKLESSLKWREVEKSEKTVNKSTTKGATTTAVVTSSSAAATPPPMSKRKASVYQIMSQIDDDDMSDSSDESDEEEEVMIERRQDVGSDLPSEYWQIQKLVKYLKGGNQTATIISLCAMMDFNLTQETCQLAIRDVGGLEVLINLLDTEENKCKIGALKILKGITKNIQIRRAVADLGGLQTMVTILQTKNKDLKCLTAETIANVAKFKRARRTVRQHGGIKKLVDLLNFPENSKDMVMDMKVARSGALALLSCSKSAKNKQSIRKAGAIPMLARLLKSNNESMLIPVVGTLQECASESSYRLAIRKEGMIPYLVQNLASENPELQMHCAAAIFKCAEDRETRGLVRSFNGLTPLVNMLARSDDKQLLAAATGAIWKCSKSPQNVKIFQEMKAIERLVSLLDDQPEEVLVNVVGAIAECSKNPSNLSIIRKSGGIPPLIQLLTGTNQSLLVNVTLAVGSCATETENMQIIDRLDGVRLLWSLLKNTNPEVQASAAWAVCPCIENAKDAGEMVRSFVGGLELIVSLLKSDDQEVLASCCAAIANIAKDEENLAVITDHGVVPMLAKLASTEDDKLRRHLASAIAQCCKWGDNRVAFGYEGAVAPLVGYLKSRDLMVHRATSSALYQLSRDPQNCITMHENSVVKHLLKMVGSKDTALQESAAGCIGNIRRLALANEKARYG